METFEHESQACGVCVRRHRNRLGAALAVFAFGAVSSCAGSVDYDPTGADESAVDERVVDGAAPSGGSAGSNLASGLTLERAVELGLPAAVAEDSVLASVAEGQYRLGFPWVKINATPFPSAVASGSINVWVSGLGSEAYARVAFESNLATSVNLPPGALIVREVLDASGAVSAITLMLKGAPGYNPDLGDFWFGALNADGSPKHDASGAERLGKLSECYGCHVPREAQGYLFGAPARNRTPYMDLAEWVSSAD
jgi:hypothetical protein